MKALALVFLFPLFAVWAVAAEPLEGSWEWQCSVLASGDVVGPADVGYSRTLYFVHVTYPFEFVEVRNYEIFTIGIWSVREIPEGPFLEVDNGDSVMYMSGVLEFSSNDDMLVIKNFDDEYFVRAGAISNGALGWGSVKALYR